LLNHRVTVRWTGWWKCSWKLWTTGPTSRQPFQIAGYISPQRWPNHVEVGLEAPGVHCGPVGDQFTQRCEFRVVKSFCVTQKNGTPGKQVGVDVIQKQWTNVWLPTGFPQGSGLEIHPDGVQIIGRDAQEGEIRGFDTSS
jgi:hypothetical protein